MKIDMEQVRHIVENNSGGVKFIELLILMTPLYLKKKGFNSKNFSIIFERAIRKDKELKILDYTYKSLSRAKMFVYTP